MDYLVETKEVFSFFLKPTKGEGKDMQPPTESELREHLSALEAALDSLRCLSLLAEKEEAARLEETAKRLLSHAQLLRSALT